MPMKANRKMIASLTVASSLFLAANTSSAATHAVKSGDSLDRLANRHNDFTTALKLRNNLPSEFMIPGQKLKVGESSVQSPAKVTHSAPVIYTVNRGDTLSWIAVIHGMSLNELLKLNPAITDPSAIFPGQKIKVNGSPAKEAPLRSTPAPKPQAKPQATPQPQARTEAQTRPDRPDRSAPSKKADAVAVEARRHTEKPYKYGSAGPNSFDCSGFTSYVYKQAAGVNLPRSSRAQSGYGSPVSKANLRSGDLLYFGNGISHVAIYIGNGKMAHAANEKTDVTIESMNSRYWQSHFVSARRVVR